MNCGCLPGFPGENHKQLLNAIVRQAGLVLGDFETFQKRAWESAKVVIRHLAGRGLGVLLLYLESEFCCPPFLSLLWICSVTELALRRVEAGLGCKCEGDSCFALVHSFDCFLLSLGVVVPLCPWAVGRAFLYLCVQFSSIGATSVYSSQLWGHQGLIKGLGLLLS